MPTSVTPKPSSQSASACSPPSVEGKPRVCCSRCRLRLAGTRTVAITLSRCTSRPAQRSTRTSICCLLPEGGQVAVRRGLLSTNLRYALEAAVSCSAGPHTMLPRELAASSTTGVAPERHPDSHPPVVAAASAVIAYFPQSATPVACAGPVPPIRLLKRGCRLGRAPLRPCGAAHDSARSECVV